MPVRLAGIPSCRSDMRRLQGPEFSRPSLRVETVRLDRLHVLRLHVLHPQIWSREFDELPVFDSGGQRLLSGFEMIKEAFVSVALLLSCTCKAEDRQIPQLIVVAAECSMRPLHRLVVPGS